MQHVMFTQKLKKDKVKEYIKTHKKVWLELLKATKEAGIVREIIWMDKETTYAYMMVEDFEGAMKKLAKTKVFKDWVKKMEPFMDIAPDYTGGGKIVELEKVFDLEKQLEELDK